MELITEKGRLDLYENFSYSLNYKSAEIVNLKGRKASFSKTIKIPYTKTNSSIFEGLQEFNVDNVGYNTKRSLKCFISHNGSILMNGTLTVLQFDETKEEKAIQLQLIAKVKNLITELKNLNLNEIDFTRWNHDYSQGGIFNNIIYNACDLDDVTIQAELGKGYCYPLVDYGKDDSSGLDTWKVTDLKPTLFLKEYIDTLFRFAGISYTSLFFESPFWRSLVILNSSNSIEFSAEQIQPFESLVERTTVQKTYVDNGNYPLGSAGGFPIGAGNQLFFDQFTYLDFTNEVIDSENQWNIGIPEDTFTATRTGKFKFTLNAEFYHEFTVDPNSVEGQLAVNQQFLLGQPTTYTINPNGIIESHFIEIVKNGIVFDFSDQKAVAPNSISQYLDWSGPWIINWLRPEGIKNKTIEFTVDLVEGDEIKFRTVDEARNTTTNQSLIHRFYFESFSVKTEIVKTLIAEGDQINFDNYISRIKATDFINGIFDIFNLWVIDDPLNEDNLIIEPRSNFFDSGGYVDVSKKLDISKTISSDFLADKLPKFYNYLFRGGNDVANANYNASNKIGYSDFISEVDVDFTNKEQNIQTIFAPLITQETGGLYYPKEFELNGTDKSPIGEFLKIGFVELIEGEFTLKSDISPDITIPKYWKVSEFNSLESPTFSLTYGTPETLINLDKNPYWNLYRLFHEITENEQTRNGSKEITAYFNLTETDIAGLDLRRAWFVRGVYFRIISIDNFNPLSNSPTKVKLLQVDNPKYDYTSNEVIYSKGFENNEINVVGTNKPNRILNTKSGYVQSN